MLYDVTARLLPGDGLLQGPEKRAVVERRLGTFKVMRGASLYAYAVVPWGLRLLVEAVPPATLHLIVHRSRILPATEINALEGTKGKRHWSRGFECRSVTWDEAVAVRDELRSLHGIPWTVPVQGLEGCGGQ